jgi:hypothetical protein
LPVDLSQLAVYLLMFKFLKINRLILNLGEERKAINIKNSFIAIPAMIVSIMYIIAIHKETIINPLYIVGFTVSQDDFGFEINSEKYIRTKEIIWGVMLLIIAIKIGKILF